MIKQQEQVKIFHNIFKQPVLNYPQIPAPDRCKLRYDLIAEELREFKDAYEANDLVESADALIDLLYVVYGSLLEFGLGDATEDLFDEVQKSNLSKLDENGQVLYKPNGKVKKSDLFQQPKLKPIIDKYIEKILLELKEKTFFLFNKVKENCYTIPVMSEQEAQKEFNPISFIDENSDDFLVDGKNGLVRNGFEMIE